MNVISLFTGVGGFDLGLERAGHRIVAQCEADEKARAVLRRHWPDVPIHEDVCGFDAEWCQRNGIRSLRIGSSRSQLQHSNQSNTEGSLKRHKPVADDIHLVCGGFPCQDLSVAGKRAGLAGERSGLFFEAARISDLVLRDGGWVLIENVPGLLSSNGGRDFGVVLATLADLGFHDLAWRVLDSRYFGVPQRRRRVFILARRARGRRAAEVLLEPEGGGGNHQASREARANLAGRTRSGAKPVSALTRRFGNSGSDLPDAEAGWLVSRATSAGTNKESGSGRSQRGGRSDSKRHGRDLVSPPPDPDRVRTPSGFPGRVDDPVTCAYDPKPDGPRYAQMGNAVSVPVAEWIGHRLREFGCES